MCTFYVSGFLASTLKYVSENPHTSYITVHDCVSRCHLSLMLLPGNSIQLLAGPHPTWRHWSQAAMLGYKFTGHYKGHSVLPFGWCVTKGGLFFVVVVVISNCSVLIKPHLWQCTVMQSKPEGCLSRPLLPIQSCLGDVRLKWTSRRDGAGSLASCCGNGVLTERARDLSK